MQVSMVPPEHVDSVWEKVEKYLEGAAEYTYGRYTVDDMYDAVTQYDHSLWIAFDEKGVKGVVLTRFVDYPRKRYLSMDFTGGVELDKWKAPMLKLLQHWAYDNLCDGIESSGRPGWMKIFKNDTGYRALWHTYELPAANAGLGAGNG